MDARHRSPETTVVGCTRTSFPRRLNNARSHGQKGAVRASAGSGKFLANSRLNYCTGPPTELPTLVNMLRDSVLMKRHARSVLLLYPLFLLLSNVIALKLKSRFINDKGSFFLDKKNFRTFEWV